MRKSIKLLVVALAATIALSIAAGTATASASLEAGTTTLRSTARALTFAGSNGNRLICDVTLFGTLARAVRKERGQHIGTITRANTANCTNNLGVEPTSFTWLTPILLTYESFAGSLPTSDSILMRFVEAGLQIIIFFGFYNCLFRGDQLAVVERAGRITVPNGEQIPLSSERGSSECEREISFAGSFTNAPVLPIRLLS